jgi:hypothetical protein
MVLSPIEQLKRHFLGDQEFTTNFIKFVRETIKGFNREYLNRPVVQFVIYSLNYNVKTRTYSTKVYNPEGPKEEARKVAEGLADSMIGLTHPIYCVGYIVSADGYVSKYDFEDKDEKEALRQIAEGDDPLCTEMIIHTVVSITGISRMNVYEILRNKGEIRNSGISNMKSTLSGTMAQLFSKAEEAFIQTYEDLSPEEKEHIKKNIFE